MKDPLSTADALFAGSNPRAALQVLRRAATRDRPPFTVRRRLAEIYRAWGYPDEAGRWGIVIDGWTTPRERDRLARSIEARGVPPRYVLAHLAIPPDIPSNSDVTDVRDRLLERLRQWRTDHPRRPIREARRTRAFAREYLGRSAIVAGVGLLIVFIWVVIGGFDTARYWALWTIGLTLGLFAVGSLLRGAAGVAERRVRPAVLFLTLGLTAIAGVLTIVAAAVSAHWST